MFETLKSKVAVALIFVTMCGTLAQAGWVNGPGHDVEVVQAYSSIEYTLVFRGGEWASVIVDGDGDTDLDLYIYDENGNLIDYDNDYTDYCVTSFTPRWTGRFTIRIVNRGSVWNRFVLRVN